HLAGRASECGLGAKYGGDRELVGARCVARVGRYGRSGPRCNEPDRNDQRAPDDARLSRRELSFQCQLGTPAFEALRGFVGTLARPGGVHLRIALAGELLILELERLRVPVADLLGEARLDRGACRVDPCVHARLDLRKMTRGVVLNGVSERDVAERCTYPALL